MKRQTVVIIAGSAAVLMISVTLLAAAGLWLGVNLIQRQMSIAPAIGPLARLADSDLNQNGAPFSRSFGGPGMMWGNETWEGQSEGRGFGGPGMMWGNRSGGSWPNSGAHGGPGMMWGGRPGDGRPNSRGLGGPGMMWNDGNWNRDDMPCAEDSASPGTRPGGWGAMPCDSQSYSSPGAGDVLSLEEAEAAAAGYLDRLGYAGLHLTEMMEFEHNFYAIVAEENTGNGAKDLLVDTSSGAVGPAPGPNMMWNAKYGMHRGGRLGMRRSELAEGMGSFSTGEMTLMPAEAEELAQVWLDASLPGRTAGEADEFYGYYTLHYLKDGEIEGMLSVHGSSGDIWHHSWHGDFVAMSGGHE